MNECNLKDQIIVFYIDDLLIGGIETYVYKIAKQIKSENGKIVWIAKSDSKIDDSFKSVFYDGNTIIMHSLDCEKFEEMVKSSNTEIKIVSFDLYHFALSEVFKKKFGKCRVHNFYFVPHFVGDTLYLEESYTDKKRERVRRYMSTVISKMNDGCNIRYFSEKHIDKMTSTYGYSVGNVIISMVPSSDFTNKSFDEERCRKLATRDRFNILTASRFEFPHKGYILGLIDAYSTLKPKYPQLELTIVGYGPGISEIEKKVSLLSNEISKDIHLEGKASPEKLIEYYNDANVNISVAGCCSSGAKNGTLSIPARHYVYDCEVYGFLPESKPFTVSEEPGQPVIPYIEQIINMSTEEYCRRCKDSFETFKSDDVTKRETFEQIANISDKATLNDDEIKYIVKEEKKRLRRNFINGYIGVFSKEGIIKPVVRKLKKIFKGKN